MPPFIIIQLDKADKVSIAQEGGEMEEKKTDVKIEISLPHNAGRNSVETAKKQMKEWIEKAEELEKEHSVNCTLCFKA